MTDFEALYRETGNPLYVWKALADYQLCPDGAPLPGWIMACLREAALALEMLADGEQPDMAAKAVTAVLGLTGPGRNRFADYRQDIRALNAAHIHDTRRELFVPPSGLPENADASNLWLEAALGLEAAKRRTPDNYSPSRRVAQLVARGRKLKAAMTR
jgi:hypothetical protein